MFKSDLLVTFGEEVRRRRVALNMTLEELADGAGLTPNFIGTIENGKRDPSVSTILALARGFRIRPSEFFPSMADLSAASEEAGRLFELASLEVQKAVLMILRSQLRK